MRPIEFGVASTPLAGEAVSGDAHLVAAFEGGVLIAVVDGLGHGREAAEASRAAVADLERQAGRPVAELLASCHHSLRKTRGAAVSVATIDERAGALEWGGVGNVEGVLLRAGPREPRRESISLRGGVVGFQLPQVRASKVAVHPGDLLIFATDGIRAGFSDISTRGTPQEVAERILEQHGRRTDDALVLVARCGEGAAR